MVASRRCDQGWQLTARRFEARRWADPTGSCAGAAATTRRARATVFPHLDLGPRGDLHATSGRTLRPAIRTNFARPAGASTPTHPSARSSDWDAVTYLTLARH